MANRRNFYFNQKLTEAEIDDAMDQLEKADRDLCSDLSMVGIVEGFEIEPHEDSGFVVLRSKTGKHIAYSPSGERIYAEGDIVVNIETESYSNETTSVSAADKCRFVGIYISFDRAYSEKRLDGNQAEVLYRADESFLVTTKKSQEAYEVFPSTPPITEENELCLGLVARFYGETKVLSSHISKEGRSRWTGADARDISANSPTETSPLVDCIENIESRIENSSGSDNDQLKKSTELEADLKRLNDELDDLYSKIDSSESELVKFDDELRRHREYNSAHTSGEITLNDGRTLGEAIDRLDRDIVDGSLIKVSIRSGHSYNTGSPTAVDVQVPTNPDGHDPLSGDKKTAVNWAGESELTLEDAIDSVYGLSRDGGIHVAEWATDKFTKRDDNTGVVFNLANLCVPMSWGKVENSSHKIFIGTPNLYKLVDGFASLRGWRESFLAGRSDGDEFIYWAAFTDGYIIDAKITATSWVDSETNDSPRQASQDSSKSFTADKSMEYNAMKWPNDYTQPSASLVLKEIIEDDRAGIIGYVFSIFYSGKSSDSSWNGMPGPGTPGAGELVTIQITGTNKPMPMIHEMASLQAFSGVLGEGVSAEVGDRLGIKNP